MKKYDLSENQAEAEKALKTQDVSGHAGHSLLKGVKGFFPSLRVRLALCAANEIAFPRVYGAIEIPWPKDRGGVYVARACRWYGARPPPLKTIIYFEYAETNDRVREEGNRYAQGIWIQMVTEEKKSFCKL